MIGALRKSAAYYVRPLEGIVFDLPIVILLSIKEDLVGIKNFQYLIYVFFLKWPTSRRAI